MIDYFSERSLACRITTWPISGNPRGAQHVLKEVRALASPQTDEALSQLLADLPDAAKLLAGTFLGSSYLKRLAAMDPTRLLRILSRPPEDVFAQLLVRMDQAAREAKDEADLMRALRQAKQEAALLTGLADCAGVWPLMQVTDALTTLAERACSAALVWLLREQAARGKVKIDPDAPETGCGYFILGMGKLGARELNYSSDIDLIAFYDRDIVRLKDAEEHQAFYVRITQSLSRIINNQTYDGQVFRVDLRLRPDPGSTPVAISTALALSYYETVGQNWERAAMIKARPIAGDLAAGEAFLKEIRPFIWRKFLDFAAIADIHAMKRQIHAVKGHGSIAVEGHNLKLGRGGIREIEFFAQTQQLIAGGRDPSLRCRGTLEALDALVQANWIRPEVRDELVECYHVLRTFEHRIQMMEDAQTHNLPEDEKTFLTFTRFAGFATKAAFSKRLKGVLTGVQKHYAELFEDRSGELPSTRHLGFSGTDYDPETLEALRVMGFENGRQAVDTIRLWLSGRYAATRAPLAQERLNEIIPRLTEALGITDNPDAALIAFDQFLARLPAGVQVFSLLRSNPNLIDLLAEIIGIAPRLARTLSRRPRVLDGLIEQFHAPANDPFTDFDTRLERVLLDASDTEDVLDRARAFAQEQMFIIGVRILVGALPPANAGMAYTNLATAIVRAMHGQVERDMIARHGQTPRRASAVLALGKFGSGEMTASSDLDLILLYDDDALDSSDGPKPLYASEYYTRYTQRLIGALSAPTSQGTIYEVDFRLRPSGNKGPLATSIKAFLDYQTNEAWTWEHMALTRSRVVSSTPGFQQQVEAAIASIVVRPRDLAKLKTDIRDMRKTLLAEKPAKSEWDLKMIAGGIIDIEFIAQYLVLGYAHEHAGLYGVTTPRTFALARDAGLIDDDTARILVEASHFYSTLTQAVRLCLDADFDPGSSPKGLAKRIAIAAGMPDLRGVTHEINETAARVRTAFEQQLGAMAWPGVEKAKARRNNDRT